MEKSYVLALRDLLFWGSRALAGVEVGSSLGYSRAGEVVWSWSSASLIKAVSSDSSPGALGGARVYSGSVCRMSLARFAGRSRRGFFDARGSIFTSQVYLRVERWSGSARGHQRRCILPLAGLDRLMTSMTSHTFNALVTPCWWTGHDPAIG